MGGMSRQKRNREMLLAGGIQTHPGRTLPLPSLFSPTHCGQNLKISCRLITDFGGKVSNLEPYKLLSFNNKTEAFQYVVKQYNIKTPCFIGIGMERAGVIWYGEGEKRSQCPFEEL